MKRGRTLATSTLLLCAAAVALSAAGEDRQETGKQLYQQYCASCHGVDGRGRTPLANLFERKPPDLTRISLRGEGWFPEGMVKEIVDGRLVAHGSREMPVWGEILTPAQIQLITEHISSIQDRSPAAAP
jgi:mono/diheme cytochrome c family protein